MATVECPAIFISVKASALDAPRRVTALSFMLWPVAISTEPLQRRPYRKANSSAPLLDAGAYSPKPNATLHGVERLPESDGEAFTPELETGICIDLVNEFRIKFS